MRNYIIFSILLICINGLNAQISCQSKHAPYFLGTCQTASNCVGATLTGICANNNHVCCIDDPEITVGNTNAMITLSTFQSLVGNTAQSRAYYGLFARAMSEAGVVTCHQAAAFLAHLQGETANFTMFEETGDTSKFDNETSIGNNAVGDGDKYRGRGSLFLRGKGNYANASINILGIKYNLLQEPERAAFPSVAFKIASWTWTKNSYLITQNAPAVKGNLNQLADGTYHNFTLLSHAISTNVQHLKERSILYEDSVRFLKSIGKDCKLIKRGSGIKCEINKKIGKAVPMCLSDFNKPFCGCGGEFQKDSCPYGFNSVSQCRSSSVVKCCYEKCDTYLDLVFVLDSSGSIGSANFIKEKDFVANVVKSLDIGRNATRVGIINYSSNTQVIARLNSYYDKNQLIQVINNIPYLSGGTATAEALLDTNSIVLNESNGMRPIEDAIPKVVVVITDGVSNSPPATLSAAQTIKKRGVSIVSVGVGTGINQIELEGMATNPDDVYNVDNYNKIFEIIEGLSKTACEQPAKVVFEQTIESRVQKDSYKYYKLEIQPKGNNTFEEFSISLVNILGKTKLYYSFDEENPKDPNDFIPDTPTEGGAYIEKNMIAQNNNSIVYQILRPTNKNVLFVSVKGFLDENEFQVYIHNETILIETTTSTVTEPTTTIVETTTTTTIMTETKPIPNTEAPTFSHLPTTTTAGSQKFYCNQTFFVFVLAMVCFINYYLK